MNILHVLTTGSSLVDKIKERAEDDDRTLADALVPGAEGPGTVPDMLLAARAAGGTKLDLDQLLRPEQRRRLEIASHIDAAEWTSARTIRSDPRFPHPDRESFLYLASDTDDGLRAAALLAVGHEPTSVHYVHQPLEHGDSMIRPGEAWICRIPRLDLGDAGRAPTHTTWRSLGAAGRLAARTAGMQPGPWTVVVHFSGGYKAIVPYVMVLAEAIRSRLGPNGPAVRAVAQHKSSVVRGNRVVIEVPVRAMFDPDLQEDVDVLRAALKDDSDDVPVGTAQGLSGLMVETVDARSARVTVPGLISLYVLR